VKTVAIIQPYFFPYPGYFRLFAAADEVVMFDCVQFPRRGWVHRNRFARADGTLDWLTLPLAKAPRDITIDRLEFADNAGPTLEASIRRFPVLDAGLRSGNDLVQTMLACGRDVTRYLIDTLAATTRALGLRGPGIRSSSLNIANDLHGQDRVIAIVHALGGTHYINPSGGRALYDQETFRNADISLGFLTPWSGPVESTLSRLLTEPAPRVADELRLQSIVEA